MLDEIEIRRGNGDVLRCPASALVPERLGLARAPRALVLEYRAPSVRAHHWMPLRAADPATEAARLVSEHAMWLSSVSRAQVQELVARAPAAPAALSALSEALSSAEAAGLGRLLGDLSGAPEWLQGWCFEPAAAEHGPYGLRQAQGGPCGVIAAVQAFLLRRLLSGFGAGLASAPVSACHAALRDAMTEILFQCAEPGAPVRVVAPGSEPLAAHRFAEPGRLRGAWDDELSAYFGGGPGVLHFLQSAVLTRGLAGLRADADEEPRMIGRHGYCTQEAVNLLLTGRGTSNVFDGERLLDGARLRGVARRARVGFLSLFEALGCLEVGEHYKSPWSPVWLLHAESHYSVAFAEPEPGPEFDVWYYDPQGRQDEEKRITVRPNRLTQPEPEDDLETNGMIAKVLRTKFGALAELDWNGAEPIY